MGWNLFVCPRVFFGFRGSVLGVGREAPSDQGRLELGLLLRLLGLLLVQVLPAVPAAYGAGGQHAPRGRLLQLDDAQL